MRMSGADASAILEATCALAWAVAFARPAKPSVCLGRQQEEETTIDDRPGIALAGIRES